MDSNDSNRIGFRFGQECEWDTLGPKVWDLAMAARQHEFVLELRRFGNPGSHDSESVHRRFLSVSLSVALKSISVDMPDSPIVSRDAGMHL
jgi:hypothetical protein